MSPVEACYIAVHILVKSKHFLLIVKLIMVVKKCSSLYLALVLSSCCWTTLLAISKKAYLKKCFLFIIFMKNLMDLKAHVKERKKFRTLISLTTDFANFKLWMLNKNISNFMCIWKSAITAFLIFFVYLQVKWLKR